jgi:ankyrin repeat protein
VAAFFDLKEWAQYLCSEEGWVQKMEKRNSDLMTPLFVAAARESTRVFAILLDHGAERTIMDENVFHFACRVGSRAIVSLLLERGIDVNETTPAIGLLQCLTSAFRLLPGLSGIVSVRRSSEWNDVLFLQFFGEKTTPLHNAVLGGHEDIVRMLLVHEADVNRGTLQNGTAAHIAAWKGTPHMLELLKDYKADFSRPTSTGWYPIHCAAAHGNEATMLWLLNNGASVDSKTADGETALHLTAQYGLDHTAKLLLDSKAVVDAKTVEGLTPLHIAAQSGHDNVVLLLLMYNADQKVITKNGKTALQLAEGASNNSAAQILRSAERVEKNSDGHMTSEGDFSIPHIGVPQVPLPPFVLHAIESGLSTLGSRRTKTAPPHGKRYDKDDLEQPRHGKAHDHHHNHDEDFEVGSSRDPEHETAPGEKREGYWQKRSSVHFDNESTSKPARTDVGNMSSRRRNSVQG